MTENSHHMHDRATDNTDKKRSPGAFVLPQYSTNLPCLASAIAVEPGGAIAPNSVEPVEAVENASSTAGGIATEGFRDSVESVEFSLEKIAKSRGKLAALENNIVLLDSALQELAKVLHTSTESRSPFIAMLPVVEEANSTGSTGSTD